jgi:tetratricopeptide (TPR) repeat protein
LAKHEALQNDPASTGAARNNWALVQLSKGRYVLAATAFQRAAAERLAGGDKHGYVISTGNLALCLYQNGNFASALKQLHASHELATDNGDDLGRAKIAEYLASVYLGWGDTNTANAFATEAENIYRDKNRVADLAPTLRLRARIEADRGNLDAALTVIQEAWALAIDNQQLQAAANIASAYADILLDRGELVATGKFIRDANDRFGQKYEAHDRLNLSVVELRWLRLSGNHREARNLGARLLARVRYPGLLRTRVLIERYLLALSENESTTDKHDRFRSLLTEIRRGVAMAPDPELAFRLLEVVRPAAEATIAATLGRCAGSSNCVDDALTYALEYFALEPEFNGRSTRVDTSELQGLLQSLSTMQARGDLSAAPDQLKARIEQLQSVARMQPVLVSQPNCKGCEQVRPDDTNLIYFFGSEGSWRWQRVGQTWDIRELPKWSVLAGKLRLLETIETRRDAVNSLSVLAAGLPNFQSANLSVGGDARVSQIPLSALKLSEDETVIDRYAVSVRIGKRKALPNTTASAGFLGNEGVGDKALPMVDAERRIVRAWSERVGLPLVADDAVGRQPMTLLHISAHGQRDVGGGSSILWLGAHPLLSYLFANQPVADTIVINACESGASPDFGLSQSSIASGFLQSGAQQVVATLFPIGDRAAAQFSEKFYATYEPAKHNLANAVRDAQLALRSSPNAGYAWAGYVVLTSPN